MNEGSRIFYDLKTKIEITVDGVVTRLFVGSELIKALKQKDKRTTAILNEEIRKIKGKQDV